MAAVGGAVGDAVEVAEQPKMMHLSCISGAEHQEQSQGGEGGRVK